VDFARFRTVIGPVIVYSGGRVIGVEQHNDFP
jgi:hypothetical protein